MKESLIKSLRAKGKTWKEVADQVGGHPNYLSSKYGEKAAPNNRRYEEFDSLNKTPSAKELAEAIKLIQSVGGKVEF